MIYVPWMSWWGEQECGKHLIRKITFPKFVYIGIAGKKKRRNKKPKGAAHITSVTLFTYVRMSIFTLCHRVHPALFSFTLRCCYLGSLRYFSIALTVSIHIYPHFFEARYLYASWNLFRLLQIFYKQIAIVIQLKYKRK